MSFAFYNVGIQNTVDSGAMSGYPGSASDIHAHGEPCAKRQRISLETRVENLESRNAALTASFLAGDKLLRTDPCVKCDRWAATGYNACCRTCDRSAGQDHSYRCPNVKFRRAASVSEDD